MKNEEEVNLEKSGKFLQLYPVLKSKDGDIIDGKHRLHANPAWKTQVLPEVDTEEKKIIARAMSNWQRRQVSAEEKSEWVNSLAEIYRNEGFATGAIAKRVAEALGCSETTARFYLSDGFKQTSKARTGERDEARVPASQVIESKFGDYGKQLVARHEAEVKQKLLKSPEFIIEAIASSPEITKIVEAPLPEVKMSKEELAKMAENIEQVQKEIEERKHDPKHIERGELVKNWMAHTRVTGVAESLHCPICGSDSSNLIWKCHNLPISEAHKMIKERLQS